MTDNWDFYIMRVDDRPASIYLDMGLKQIAPVQHYDHMAYLRVKMNKPRADGLSSQDEFDQLVALEDHLTPLLRANDLSYFAGRTTANNYRDFYFYTKDPAAFNVAANTAMSAFPDYESQTASRVDNQWAVYQDFLYPSPRAIQTMQNRQVLAALAKENDNHDLERPIDHQAVFKDKKSGQAFVAAIQEQGFEIQQISREKLWGGNHIIDIQRDDKPSQIDDITLGLFDMITELGGEYDGWGCPVRSGN